MFIYKCIFFQLKTNLLFLRLGIFGFSCRRLLGRFFFMVGFVGIFGRYVEGFLIVCFEYNSLFFFDYYCYIFLILAFSMMPYGFFLNLFVTFYLQFIDLILLFIFVIILKRFFNFCFIRKFRIFM